MKSPKKGPILHFRRAGWPCAQLRTRTEPPSPFVASPEVSIAAGSVSGLSRSGAELAESGQLVAGVFRSSFVLHPTSAQQSRCYMDVKHTAHTLNWYPTGLQLSIALRAGGPFVKGCFGGAPSADQNSPIWITAPRAVRLGLIACSLGTWPVYACITIAWSHVFCCLCGRPAKSPKRKGLLSMAVLPRTLKTVHTTYMLNSLN